MENKRPAIASPTRTRAIMTAYGLNFKKSLGQNFLTNEELLKQMVAVADISANDDVIEIGPGIGALTEQLALKAHQVVALEVDQRLLPVLAETLADYANVKVIEQDVLQADLPALIAANFTGQQQLKVVANLPYYITSPIIKFLLQQPIPLKTMVVMMQKEVAERLSAVPRTKSYGALSVLVQYQCQAKLAIMVPKSFFVPQPQVDSAIVKLVKREKIAVPVNSWSLFVKVVQGCFAHRRKNLGNNLLSIIGKKKVTKEQVAAFLNGMQLSDRMRAEELTVEQFVELTNKLQKSAIL
ncbi:MAG: 16S rRNA (adenine(1518)-N(6)/adenine(1519)-N(6))-dimethyltransferase RsmA [Liquorilactobacillus ghanensis]|uniref:16S rRNA (adenine(1518)-N(6)/adenine(1519)-N(6))- dimethyltransferase RsmA n=1 Tax=Liquorilactobacillus ghanensis TaxID=399370 RepID=UPI0039E79E87